MKVCKRVKVDDVIVARAKIYIMCDEQEVGTDIGYSYVLVYKKDGKYFDIFTNKQILKDQESAKYCTIYNKKEEFIYNTPYIVSTEPLRKYMFMPSKKSNIDIKSLGTFLAALNAKD